MPIAIIKATNASNTILRLVHRMVIDCKDKDISRTENCVDNTYFKLVNLPGYNQYSTLNSRP